MKRNESNIPKEWIELIKEAMKANITKEDFKIYLKEEKEKREKK
ncbi:anti-repressor SinI family protein [Neobacillus sp. Marseille-QA0830]